MQLASCNFKTKKWAVVNSKLKVPVNFSVLVFNGGPLSAAVYMLYLVSKILMWEWTKGRIKPSFWIKSSAIAEWSLLVSEVQSLQPCSPLMKDRSKSHSQPRTPRTDKKTQEAGKVSYLFSSLSFSISCSYTETLKIVKALSIQTTSLGGLWCHWF